MRIQGTVQTPPGFVYVPACISVDEERDLIERIERLTFTEVRMRGVVARRTVVHFGWDYGANGARLEPTVAIPPELLFIRQRLAAQVNADPEQFEQALVARYPPGAGIGWHQDAPLFGPIVLGLSLGGACVMRFRPTRDSTRAVLKITMEPRSGYALTGPSRSAWQHSISPVKELRYSVTFRSMRG